jgi:hypothetical protein
MRDVIERERPADWLFGVLVFALLGLIAASFRDFGVLWDDPDHRRNGDLFLDFYRSWRSQVIDGHFDVEVWVPGLLQYRAALFDGTGSLLNLVSPFGEFETRRLLGGGVGLVGIAGCWALTRQLAGPLAALFAALCLSLYPIYYGHAFMNPKDIPFAAGYVWSLFYLVRCIRSYPAVPNGLSIRLGIAIGLTLSIRIGGLLLLCYVAVAMAIHLARRIRSSGWTRALHSDALPLARSGLTTFAVAYPIMLFWWPWAQLSPFKHPIEAFQTAAHHPWPGKILFAGEFVHSTDLPGSYLPHYFLVQTPEFVLFGLLLASGFGIQRLVRGALRHERAEQLVWGMLFFALVFPPLFAILDEAVLYDTFRHFLFLVPLIASLAGMGFAAGGRWLQGRHAVLRYGATALLGLVLAQHVHVMSLLHPHYYIYYNQLVGGVSGANGRYEMDYWGNSYAEAVRMLVDRLRRENPRRFARTRYDIHVCGGWFYGAATSAVYFFPRNFRHTNEVEKADFVLCLTRWNRDREIEAPVYFEVERFGVPLAVVKDRRRL